MPAAGPERLSDAGAEFLRERHLATFTSLRADGRPHVTPVGFTWDPDRGVARVITSATSVKARSVGAGRDAVALCQLDGRRWLTVEGIARVTTDPGAVADAVARYAERYRPPRVNPTRVAIEITATRLLGSAEFFR